MTEQSEAYIRFPIGDFIALAMRNEIDIQTAEDIVEAVQKFSTADVARMLGALRHLGKSPDSILPTDKLLWEHGTMAAVAAVVKSVMTKVKVGKRECEIEIPVVVADVQVFPPHEEGEQEPPAYMPSVSKEAIEAAKEYLRKVVPGHVRGRLEILAANRVHLGPIVAEVKDRIDEIAKELEA